MQAFSRCDAHSHSLKALAHFVRRQYIDRWCSIRGYGHQIVSTRTMIGSFCIVLQICSC